MEQKPNLYFFPPLRPARTHDSVYSQSMYSLPSLAPTDGSEKELVEHVKLEVALPPPDQGVAAWATVVGGFCLLFVSFGWISCIGVFQSYYQTHQLAAYSPSTVAWISSVETCVIFLWGPVVGRLFDNHGPRWLLCAGTVLHVLGLFMVSMCTEYYQFILAQSMCSATGAAFLFFTAATSVSTWFQRHRGLALGITMAGSSLGGVIFPIMVHRLVPQIGFAGTMKACALLVLALSTFANFVVTSRLQHSSKTFRISDYWRPFRDGPFGFFTFAYFLFYLGFFVPYNFIILQAERYGMSPGLAAYLVTIMNAGGFFGRIAPGWLADRVGRFNIMILITFFSSLVVLGLWIPGQDDGAIIAFCILYGFSSGAFISLAPAILAQISPLPELGVRQGTCFAFTAIASLLSNPIAGLLVPNTSVDPFWKLQVYTGLMMFAGGVMMVVARVVAGGKSLLKVI